MNEITAELKSVICKNPESLYDACMAFLLLVEGKEEPQRPVYLQSFLAEIELSDMVSRVPENFMEINCISEESQKELLQLKNRIIYNLIQNRVSVTIFYQELWNKLTDISLIPDIEMRAAFLQTLWMDNRIPYYQLDKGYIMGNDQYRKIIDAIRPSLKKGTFILNTNLKYKTERASLLLDIAKELDSEEEQIVFWAFLIDKLREKVRILNQSLAEERAKAPYHEDTQ